MKTATNMGKNPKVPGVYRIFCTANKRYYVGETNSLGYRWLQHNDQLRRNAGENKELQDDWNKYGPALFEWHVLESGKGFETETFRKHIERKYIEIDVEAAYNFVKPPLRNSERWEGKEINGVFYNNFSDLLLAFDITKSVAEGLLVRPDYIWPKPKLSLEQVTAITKEKMLKNKLENCKFRISVNGIVYRSAYEAQKALDISYATLNERLENPSINYFFIDKNSNPVDNIYALTTFAGSRRVGIDGITYPSIAEASRKTGFGISQIRMRCDSQDEQYKNFEFLDPPSDPRFLEARPVQIKGIVYSSISEASRKTGIPDRTIFGRCTSKFNLDYKFCEPKKKPRISQSKRSFWKNLQ